MNFNNKNIKIENQTQSKTSILSSMNIRETKNEAIAKKGMFAHIDATFLKRLVALFSIPDYDTFAAILVSGKYTYPEELSCHRKALLGNMQPLKELNAYVEQCKSLAAQCFDNLIIK
jgi:hypothetical protein